MSESVFVGKACVLGIQSRDGAMLNHYLAIAEASQRDNDICRALNAVAQVYIGLEMFQKAEHYAQRAVALCRALGYQEMLCDAAQYGGGMFCGTGPPRNGTCRL